jgi:hypothetical protein
MVAKLSALYMQAANEQVNAHLGNELEEDSSNRA